jgi:Na+/melibiose symporter-like transporter
MPYKLLVAALFLAYIAETFRITITLFYARDVIGVANIGLVYVFYFAVGLGAVPVWSLLAKALGKHKALGLALTVVLVTNVSLFFLNRGQEAAFIAIFMVKGFCFGALELLPAALIADTTDIDTARSRARRQGLFFSFMTMTNKIGQAIGQGLSLILLSAIGYTASGETNLQTLFGMKALYGLLPVLFLAPAIWVLWRYPFTQSRHGRLRAAILRREARLS